MENLLNDNVLLIIAAIATGIAAVSEYLGTTKRFESNSAIQIGGKIASGLLRLIKRS